MSYAIVEEYSTVLIGSGCSGYDSNSGGYLVRANALARERLGQEENWE